MTDQAVRDKTESVLATAENNDDDYDELGPQPITKLEVSKKFISI